MKAQKKKDSIENSEWFFRCFCQSMFVIDWLTFVVSLRVRTEIRQSGSMENQLTSACPSELLVVLVESEASLVISFGTLTFGSRKFVEETHDDEGEQNIRPPQF